MRHQGIIPEDGSILHPYVGDLARQNKQHRYEFHLGYIGEVLKNLTFKALLSGMQIHRFPGEWLLQLSWTAKGSASRLCKR